ncbi:MAG: hypothetical protein OXC63_06550 [Aestuariivita sp.]|nr:hypothetical protein [Aestuariivita sp.]MCY4348121.1 hypothetical protein [Aestuariivita sp.]
MQRPCDHIELNRHFVPLSTEDVAQERFEIQSAWSNPVLPVWQDLLEQHRVVLLSAAGTGKTCEIQHQCCQLRQNGKFAFFLRLEYLALGLCDTVFEQGDMDSFTPALENNDEIWLFLDSIDEARLDGPQKFEQALKHLRSHIKNNLQNMHIILTSRVGAWRPTDDAARVDKLLPYTKPDDTGHSDSTADDLNGIYYFYDSEPEGSDKEHKSPIRYYTLQNLTSEQMRLYVAAKGIADVETLISEIERKDLRSLAGRPKDLDDIIAFWSEEKRLGKRRELVEVNITRKLKEDDLDRSSRVTLTPKKALVGAQKLAATVALTHHTKIAVPDQDAAEDGFAALEVLEDWAGADCLALLERPIFEPETYGFVRFDHRDSREFLAAQWFYKLIEQGQNHRVANLFFKTQYGMKIVTPSLRPILPWLALLDASVRECLLRDWPDILLEGGDPSSLVLEDRARLLKKYCAKRAQASLPFSSFDRLALQRLVSSDLSGDVKALYERYRHHSDVENFLLQAIEFGMLKDLADIALTAATKTGQSDYTRVVAMRALVAAGNHKQIQAAVSALSNSSTLADRHNLRDFIQTFGARHLSCTLVMNLIKKVAPGKRYSGDGLYRAMQSYLKDCSTKDAYAVVLETSCGLNKKPHIARYCPVSKDNAWMLNIGIPACERLVEERSPLALCDPSLSIISVARQARTCDDWDFSPRLGAQVPAWRDLNNALFWYGVAKARQQRQQDDGSRVTRWQYAWVNHRPWHFGAKDIEEVLAWIADKTLQDDKMVALNLAFDIYHEVDRPRALRRRLEAAVNGNTELSNHLKLCLDPPPMTDEEKRSPRSEANYKERLEAREQVDVTRRAEWRDIVANNLGQVRDQEQPSKNSLWKCQEYLFERMRKHRQSKQTKWSQVHWQSLAEEFGDEAAEAMRDGLQALWRRYNPMLVSEKKKKDTTCPTIQVMGLSGLEIESRAVLEWPAALKPNEANRAARYLFCEMNGFPSWLKVFADHHPELTLEIVGREAAWELFEATSEQPLHYVLSDLEWHAPWYAERLAPRFLELLQTRNPVLSAKLGIALGAILRSAEVPDRDVAALCASKIEAAKAPKEQIPLWYAAWVSVEPDPAIEHLSATLTTLPCEKATNLAIGFINALNNSRYDGGIDVREHHMKPKHLLTLHKLMHDHIRRGEDINRLACGAYSPTARDHAQGARDHIYQSLRDMPGKEAFDALMTITKAAPTEDAKAWHFRQAEMRAETDADKPWSVCKVNEFTKDLECTPSTSCDLFDIAISRLLELKYEYECGDFSLAEFVVRIDQESELRTFLANELQRRSQNRYSISQEDELPNKQRTDIRFMHSDVPGMIPVELKIADNWSGPALSRKLRDQLCGDYLRDKANKNGIFLLVFRGKKSCWRSPAAKHVSFEGLVDALQTYSIDLHATCDEFRDAAIENIRVVGIDLKKRSNVQQR